LDIAQGWRVEDYFQDGEALQEIQEKINDISLSEEYYKKSYWDFVTEAITAINAVNATSQYVIPKTDDKMPVNTLYLILLDLFALIVKDMKPDYYKKRDFEQIYFLAVELASNSYDYFTNLNHPGDIITDNINQIKNAHTFKFRDETLDLKLKGIIEAIKTRFDQAVKTNVNKDIINSCKKAEIRSDDDALQNMYVTLQSLKSHLKILENNGYLPKIPITFFKKGEEKYNTVMLDKDGLSCDVSNISTKKKLSDYVMVEGGKIVDKLELDSTNDNFQNFLAFSIGYETNGQRYYNVPTSMDVDFRGLREVALHAPLMYKRIMRYMNTEANDIALRGISIRAQINIISVPADPSASSGGARRKSKSKQKYARTQTKILFNKRQHSLYLGPRGGEYIKSKGQYISIKKLKQK
jgi:hypothetical protein